MSDAAPTEVPSPIKKSPTVHAGIVIGLLFGIAILKGLRLPSQWAVTHMTFNYSQGFLRRALFGQVLRIFGDRAYHYDVLAASAGVLLLLAGIGVFRLIRRMLASDRDDLGVRAAIMVAAASPAVVFLAHETGYLDYVGVAVMPFFIAWAARSRRLFPIFYVAMVTSVCLALVHESAIVMFAPTMLLTMLCHVLTKSEGQTPRTRVLLWVHAGLATAVALGASWVAGSLGTRTPELTDRLRDSIAAHADFPLRGDGFDALTKSLRENFFVVLPRHWSDPNNSNYLITTLVAYFPALGFLGYYGVRLIRPLALPKKSRILLTVVFLTATLCPLLLNFIGWDSARWITIAVMASFFCVAALRLYFVPTQAQDEERRHRVNDRLTLTLAAVAIVLGLCVAYQGYLYDGFVVQWFPFRTQWESAIEFVKAGFHQIPQR